MIDNLYLKEKSFVYVNQNDRQECVGNLNSIFNLEALPNIKNAPKAFAPASNDLGMINMMHVSQINPKRRE